MNKFAMLIASTVASVPMLTVSAPAPDTVAASTPTIQGAWELVVTLREDAPDCTTAPIVGVGVNPFLAFNTFNQGGTMSEWGTRAPPSTRTSGNGVWKQTGADRFRYRLLFYSFDANGLLAATMDIRTNLRLAKSGNRLTGVSRFVRTDISGNELLFCATMTGERITL